MIDYNTLNEEYWQIHYKCHVWLRKFEDSYWSCELWDRIDENEGTEIWKRLIFNFYKRKKNEMTFDKIMTDLQEELSKLSQRERYIRGQIWRHENGHTDAEEVTEEVTEEDKRILSSYRANRITLAMIELWLKDSLELIKKELLHKKSKD
jgi:hypothetical protein